MLTCVLSTLFMRGREKEKNERASEPERDESAGVVVGVGGWVGQKVNAVFAASKPLSLSS